MYEVAPTTRGTVMAALRQLPPRQRAVMVLRYYEDLSVAQAAEQLGCSEGPSRARPTESADTARGRRVPEVGDPALDGLEVPPAPLAAILREGRARRLCRRCTRVLIAVAACLAVVAGSAVVASRLGDSVPMPSDLTPATPTGPTPTGEPAARGIEVSPGSAGEGPDPCC